MKTCAHCEKNMGILENHGTREMPLCYGCAALLTCSNCNAAIEPSDTLWKEQNPYCLTCAESLLEKSQKQSEEEFLASQENRNKNSLYKKYPTNNYQNDNNKTKKKSRLWVRNTSVLGISIILLIIVLFSMLNVNNPLPLFLIFVLFVGGILAVFLYFIPAVIAYHREHDSKGWVLFLNIFLGWSGLGWLFCLFWAAFGNNEK